MLRTGLGLAALLLAGAEPAGPRKRFSGESPIDSEDAPRVHPSSRPVQVIAIETSGQFRPVAFVTPA